MLLPIICGQLVLLVSSMMTVSGLTMSTNTRQERATARTPMQVSRRNFAAGIFAAATAEGIVPARAAETVGKDESCNDANCLGVWDGLLADCPHNNKFGGGAACVSSQDDTPGVFAEPWDYAESTSLDWQDQMARLEGALTKVTQRRGDEMRLLLKQGRYVRVVFTDAKSNERSVGEFYFTPQDTTVQFRLGSLSGSGNGLLPFSQSLSNMVRAEELRKELRFLKVPVLRNRKRSFFFVEADGLDTFGPGSASLGPPAEMTTGELDGRQEEDARLRIEPLQQFPFR